MLVIHTILISFPSDVFPSWYCDMMEYLFNICCCATLQLDQNHPCFYWLQDCRLGIEFRMCFRTCCFITIIIIIITIIIIHRKYIENIGFT